MRAVISGGMLTGLEALGLRDAFDAVYGSSAGAINGAYFIAGQAAFGTTVYYENINNSRFINTARYLSGRPMMSLEFLLEDVMADEKPLDWQTVVESGISLHAIATCVDSAQSCDLTNLRTKQEMFAAFRASATIPVVAGPAVDFRGSRYLDATLVESFPYRTALADGCDHVLVLRTRPLETRLGPPSLFTRRVVAPTLARQNAALGAIVLSRPDRYNADADNLAQAVEVETGEAHVYSVCPSPSSPGVGRLEKNRDKLVAGASAGLSAVWETFTNNVPEVVEVLVACSEFGRPLS